MQTSNAKQTFGSDDPAWVLLAELSLRDFLSDPDRKEGPEAGYLFQTIRKLDVSSECMEKIARTLADFAEETLARTRQGKLEFPGRIRIFCQKKIVDNASSARTSRPYHSEQCKKQKRESPDSGVNTIGGWGYFIIERREDLPLDSYTTLHKDIDLYLYKEGE